MVKIAKMFSKKGRSAGDDTSAYISNKFSMMKNHAKKSSPTPAHEPIATPDPVTTATSSKDPSIEPSSSPIVEEEADARDEAPSPTNVAFPTDPTGANARDDVAGGRAGFLDPATGSRSVDDETFEEVTNNSSSEAEDDSNTEEEAGTVNTYEEEELEEDESYAGTDEKSYGSATYEEDDDGTRTQQDATKGLSVRSTGTSKASYMSKKYFHKDVVLNSFEDGTNNLVIRAMYYIPKPTAEDHVVVKIEASTISARDCMKCRGHGLTKAMLPFVPGHEVVGTIQILGSKVKAEGQFREGDRVAGMSSCGGGNSRFISIPTARLTKIPINVKSTQAVCMIENYMAALKALRMAKTAGSPFTGMNILITDGFSPVGQATINLASMEGANIYVCADESKHAYLASLGAKCFVKNPETWLPTATGTFDIVIDNSCIDSYNSSWFALNQKGSLVVVAPVYNIDSDLMSSAACGVVDIMELKQKWAGLKAKYMMTQTSFLNTETCYDDDSEQYKQDLRYLMFLLERGDIKAKVAERVSLNDVPDAQRLMQSGRANGTVVCVPWIED